MRRPDHHLEPGESEWPEEQINLYGPGTESGTFDFFTERVNGEEGESRSDYQASEDDNVLVQGVSGDPNALGYFGFGYFEQNQQRSRRSPSTPSCPARRLSNRASTRSRGPCSST
jgi:ABC-type phosphate transport system substrate-binding protein